MVLVDKQVAQPNGPRLVFRRIGRLHNLEFTARRLMVPRPGSVGTKDMYGTKDSNLERGNLDSVPILGNVYSCIHEENILHRVLSRLQRAC